MLTLTFIVFVNIADGSGVALDCLLVFASASRVHLAFFPEKSQNRNMFELIGNAVFSECYDQILLIFQGIFVLLNTLIYRQIPLSIDTLNSLENRLALRVTRVRISYPPSIFSQRLETTGFRAFAFTVEF